MTFSDASVMFYDEFCHMTDETDMSEIVVLGVRKRVVSKRVVLADVPPERKPERGYVRQNHPFTKPPFYLLMTLFGVDKRVVSKRVVSADVPPERKPERGYIRQNHPFTKPPFYLPVSFVFENYQK